MGLALTWGLEQSSHLGCKPCSESAGLCVVLVRDGVRRWVGRSHLVLIIVTDAQFGCSEWSCFLLCYFFSAFLPHLNGTRIVPCKPINCPGKTCPKAFSTSNWQTGGLRKSWGHCPLFTPLWPEEEHMCLWQWGMAAWLSGLPALPSPHLCWLWKDRAARICTSLCTPSQQGDDVM